MKPSPTETPKNPSPSRAPYHTPQLQVYGALRELTAGGSKPGKEVGGDVRGRS